MIVICMNKETFGKRNFACGEKTVGFIIGMKRVFKYTFLV